MSGIELSLVFAFFSMERIHWIPSCLALLEESTIGDPGRCHYAASVDMHLVAPESSPA